MNMIKGGTFAVLIVGVLLSFVAGYLLSSNSAGASSLTVIATPSTATALSVAHPTLNPNKALANPVRQCPTGWANDAYGFCFEIGNLQDWSTQNDPTGDTAFSSFLSCLQHEGGNSSVDVQTSCLKNFYPSYY